MSAYLCVQVASTLPAYMITADSKLKKMKTNIDICAAVLSQLFTHYVFAGIARNNICLATAGCCALHQIHKVAKQLDAVCAADSLRLSAAQISKNESNQFNRNQM